MKEDLIDLAGVEAFLHEHLGADVQHIQELGRGEWSVAFAYHFAGHDFVARFGFFDEDFRKDRIVAPSSSERIPIPQIKEIGSYKNGFLPSLSVPMGIFWINSMNIPCVQCFPTCLRPWMRSKKSS